MCREHMRENAAARAWARDGARVHAEAPLAPNGTPHVRLLRGLPAMAPGSHPLSEDQMRRTWALVDILTSLKRRANHPPPTAELICRKFDALSLPALDTLSIVVDHAIAEQGRRLSPRQVCGMARAVRSFPEDTAAEVAHAHACGKVVSDATIAGSRSTTPSLLTQPSCFVVRPRPSVRRDARAAARGEPRRLRAK